MTRLDEFESVGADIKGINQVQLDYKKVRNFTRESPS